MAKRFKNFRKSTILNAIKGSNGLVSNVAKLLNCEWHVAERNINRFPETIQAFQDEKETLIDFAESKAIKAINEGDGAMIRYYLSTIGRKRGYTESDEFVKESQARQKVELVLVDKPLEDK